MVKSFLYLIVITFFILFLFSISAPLNTENIKYVNFENTQVKVDLALTPSEHAKGLSGRQSLMEGEGLLFVFDKPGKYSFWMQDMNFPIDIIWLSSFQEKGQRGFKIVHIKKDASPASYPDIYAPSENAEYVLEVVAGFSEKKS